MRGSILGEANLFLAIKLQPELIIEAILQIASILRSKLRLDRMKILLKRDKTKKNFESICLKKNNFSSFAPILTQIFIFLDITVLKETIFQFF